MLGGLCPTCVRRVALAEPSLPDDTTHPTGGWEPPSVEEVAALLPAGAYLVESLIGRGGMGAVYKGWQKSLDRCVAIKILPPVLVGGDVDFAARFKREARAMARLKHPGIIPVHDAGESADGLLYFVMDFVEGTDVQKMIAARGRLPPEEALTIVTRVLDALAYAHQHGIIHRDIKPANIMVDPEGHVLVADFGLARSTAPDTALLTGQLPHGRFDPPSCVVPGLDRRLDSIVDKLLQTDRDKRYSSAIEVKTSLEPILTRTLARRPAGAPKTKRKAMLLTAALIVLAILVVAIMRHPGGPRSVVAHAPAGGGGGKAGADNRSAAEMAEGKASPSTATRDAPFINTLGMKFVPVPITGGPTSGERVLFSVWETRVQDYEIFSLQTTRTWPVPDYSQSPEHLAAMVSWEDAREFCGWLTKREQRMGVLSAKERYRLPTDHEWSCAVGIGEREDPAQPPLTKSRSIADVFPWGSEWPPRRGSGSFAGEELKPALAAGAFHKISGVIPGYRDDYVATAPVGSFPANSLGLHDLGGNLWEWCEDGIDALGHDRILRGSSWADNGRVPHFSSYRRRDTQDAHNTGYGFRCVVSAPVAAKPAGSAASGLPFSGSPPAAATREAPFINTLGMKFVPVPITGGPSSGQRVLFSVWETRVQDYRLFARETKQDWSPAPELVPDPTLPAISMSCEEAQAFCAWLTDRERKAGRLGANERYRLPTDHEWSCAVGIGDQEDPALSPAKKSGSRRCFRGEARGPCLRKRETSAARRRLATKSSASRAKP